VTAISAPMRITDNARQTSTYRRGRVLLAGDAAHVHSPIGGQGLNLGLQDAANLGWKLAVVARGLAPAELLDTYTAERHPVGAQVLRDSRAESALLRTDPQTEALREIVGELLRGPDAARQLVETVHGLQTRYDAGEDAHPLAGAFVPELALTTADGPRRVPELLRDGHALLLDLLDSRSLRDSAAGWTDRVIVVTAGCPGAADLSALLVRPDGYVAWAGGPGPTSKGSGRPSSSASVPRPEPAEHGVAVDRGSRARIGSPRSRLERCASRSAFSASSRSASTVGPWRWAAPSSARCWPCWLST
jgi:hypothetical protein